MKYFVLAVLLFIFGTVTANAIEDQEKQKALYTQELGVVEYMNEEIDNYVNTVKWDFETNKKNRDNLEAIAGIMFKYGWTSKDAGVLCGQTVDEDGNPFLFLRTQALSKINPIFKYIDDWHLYQLEDGI